MTSGHCQWYLVPEQTFIQFVMRDIFLTLSMLFSLPLIFLLPLSLCIPYSSAIISLLWSLFRSSILYYPFIQGIYYKVIWRENRQWPQWLRYGIHCKVIDRSIWSDAYQREKWYAKPPARCNLMISCAVHKAISLSRAIVMMLMLFFNQQ